MPETTANDWSQHFGLAISPMFSGEAIEQPGSHYVLLNGGDGSFGLSESVEQFDPIDAASWAWSSDLPHHVIVTPKTVRVIRWDNADATLTYSLDSVNNNLDKFYRYLCSDRLRSNRTVVERLVYLFGRIRSIVYHSHLPDHRSIDAYISVLGHLVFGSEAIVSPESYGLPSDVKEITAKIQGSQLTNTLADISYASGALSALRLYPTLAIRHAGGQIFQEAHFDLVRASPPDMFGYLGTATTVLNTRGGTYFTPPALARSLADYTLLQISDLRHREQIVVSDPACGSGALLHEVLRALRRLNFTGKLTILGSDISEAAITMARFTLHAALRDWRPEGGAVVKLTVEDSLERSSLPSADVIIMNPPFVSRIGQTREQKAQLTKIVGRAAASRGDYCMAFVTRAVEALSEGGVMGSFFPANLLSHEGLRSWRSELTAAGDVRLLATIGDFGMFLHAFVRVACVVIQKTRTRETEFTAVVTENDPGATAAALRGLRKLRGQVPMLPSEGEGWRIFSGGAEFLRLSGNWRVLTPKERGIVEALRASSVPRANKLFQIAQGVQTGHRRVFLLSEEEHRKLPARERRYFIRALRTDSIVAGRVVKEYYLFFPHSREGPLFQNEQELRGEVGEFYERVLKPNKEQLMRRAAIRRAGRTDWWGLMHPRQTSFHKGPRIISKAFGGTGSFVLDEEATYVAATAHVWLPREGAVGAEAVWDEDNEIGRMVMRAYTAILNSSVFVRLVSFQSNVLAGGQYDLGRRFVGEVALPDLWEKVSDREGWERTEELARITEGRRSGVEPMRERAEDVVAQLYGVPELAQG